MGINLGFRVQNTFIVQVVDAHMAMSMQDFALLEYNSSVGNLMMLLKKR